MLRDEAEDGRKFDRATIYRVCKKYPASREDELFQWHRMAEYSLPWEASPFLLQVLYLYLRHESQLYEEHPGIERPKPPRGHGPTVREMLWCWRVHCAMPDLPPGTVIGWAGQLTNADIAQNVFGDPYDWTGVQALLAYKPWENKERRREYAEDIKGGIIPPALEPDMSGEFPPSIPMYPVDFEEEEASNHEAQRE